MSTFTDVREQIGSSRRRDGLSLTLQDYKFEVFKEPRGIIRILQLVFAFITAVILRSYEGFVDVEYGQKNNSSLIHLPIEYPFNLNDVSVTVNTTSRIKPTIVSLQNDFSSEAEFLFTTCWVSIIFLIIICFVYIKFREDYESNGNLALVDFVVSVLLAVMWIASLGAWGYGQSELKKCTDPNFLKTSLYICNDLGCVNIIRGSVAGLTVTMIFAFLNFFLWGAGLWFLYKETPWYLQFQRT